VTGATLRSRLSLFDTWAYFTSIGVHKAPAKSAPAPSPSPTPSPDPNGTGGVTVSRVHAVAALAGSVVPAHKGAEVQVQLRRNGRWSTVGSAIVDAHGNYRTGVTKAGTYRVLYWGDAGPSISVGA
jgi:stage II sporulation protein D